MDELVTDFLVKSYENLGRMDRDFVDPVASSDSSF
jgi:hypothetical protein